MDDTAQAFGWDHPITAARYEAYCRAHRRYDEANAVLALAADLPAARSVLDYAAGTGRTAEAALPFMHPEAQLTAVEPARAMRELGAARVHDSRVQWHPAIPEALRFDRILCGAGLWQLGDLPAWLRSVRERMPIGGVLCFTMPSLYLGIPDRPGGGRDPELHALPARLAAGRTPRAQAIAPPPSLEALCDQLQAAGMTPTHTRWEHRLTQAALRDWLSIPVLTDALLGGMTIDERDARLNEAWQGVDPDAWRWEGWVCVKALVRQTTR